MNYVEPLESRTLLSVASPAQSLIADAKTLVVDFRSLVKANTANRKLLVSDLKEAGEFTESKTLVATLNNDAYAGYLAAGRSVVRAQARIRSDLLHFTILSGRLAADPGNVELQARVATAQQTLQSDAAARLSAATSAITSWLDANSRNIGAIVSANSGNSRLASDVTNTIGPRAQAASATLQSALTTLLTTDANAVTGLSQS